MPALAAAVLRVRVCMPCPAQQAASTVSDSYAAAMRSLVANLETAIGRCQMSPEGMAYNDGTPGALIKVDSDGVFFPAATWLRAFFHDAGTFIKNPSNGGPKGEQQGDRARAELQGVVSLVLAALVALASTS